MKAGELTKFLFVPLLLCAWEGIQSFGLALVAIWTWTRDLTCNFLWWSVGRALWRWILLTRDFYRETLFFGVYVAICRLSRGEIGHAEEQPNAEEEGGDILGEAAAAEQLQQAVAGAIPAFGVVMMIHMAHDMASRLSNSIPFGVISPAKIKAAIDAFLDGNTDIEGRDGELGDDDEDQEEGSEDGEGTEEEPTFLGVPIDSLWVRITKRVWGLLLCVVLLYFGLHLIVCPVWGRMRDLRVVHKGRFVDRVSIIFQGVHDNLNLDTEESLKSEIANYVAKAMFMAVMKERRASAKQKKDLQARERRFALQQEKEAQWEREFLGLVVSVIGSRISDWILSCTVVVFCASLLLPYVEKLLRGLFFHRCLRHYQQAPPANAAGGAHAPHRLKGSQVAYAFVSFIEWSRLYSADAGEFEFVVMNNKVYVRARCFSFLSVCLYTLPMVVLPYRLVRMAWAHRRVLT
uniref:Uncharacterized protein n=1 Tax=Chromera velia CCMP2878 TaxID=1169474 RepID=A0A0G4G1I5_9ALVE|eukprot:Cvel_19767.t1-p1 / transcript=Cvel_19767.t1 / gene=Cvel_19767 / organism=Chromera_velia_CCMP2878 / gene_product=hypothetical protein / transcript_product=hypothetical protein / location=Cvel_scaffold1731:31400-35311(+) / protein_length=460 / sequence_SO=supercontig / SO=protein_coding / is_pseudo=false